MGSGDFIGIDGVLYRSAGEGNVTGAKNISGDRFQRQSIIIQINNIIAHFRGYLFRSSHKITLQRNIKTLWFLSKHNY